MGFAFLKLLSLGTNHADANDGSDEITNFLLFFNLSLFTVCSICLKDSVSSSKPVLPTGVIFKFTPLPVNNFSPIANSSFSTSC